MKSLVALLKAFGATGVALRIKGSSWRDSSVVKITSDSLGGPGFGSQRPHGSSQQIVTPVLDDWCPLLASEDTEHTCGAQANMQTKQPSTLSRLVSCQPDTIWKERASTEKIPQPARPMGKCVGKPVGLPSMMETILRVG